MALRSMDRFECEFILKELAQGIGRRFKKAYMLSDGSIKLSLDGLNYIITAGKRVNVMVKRREDYKEHTFTQKMRKEMGREKLVSVELLKGDRVFLFTFERHKLAVEVYGKGAVLFYEGDEQLKAYLNRPRVEATEVSFERMVEAYSQKPLGAMLVRLLGKKYSQHIIGKFGFVEREQVAKQDVDRIREAIEWLREVAKPFSCKGDYSLIDLGGCEERKTLSEAMDEYYVLEEVDIAQLKLQKSIEKQQERVREYLEKAKEYRAVANWIFRNAPKVDELLEKARRGEIEADRKNKTVKIKVELG